jgi:peptide/nickel transport system substrate-binding protein
VTWPQASPADQNAVVNVRKAPYNSAAVRRALFTAVDRKFLADNVFFGTGSAAKGPISDRLPWAHSASVDFDTMYPYDAAKARTMLDAAGYPVQANGFRFPMNLLYDAGVTNYSQTAQSLASFWRTVGVDVKLVGLDRATWVQQVYTDWNFDIAVVAFNTQYDPAIGIQRLYLSSGIGKLPFLNGSGYNNPEVDKLFQQGQETPNRTDRAKYYNQVEKILATDMPSLVLVAYNTVAVSSKRFHGIDQGADSHNWWSEAWLER